VKSMKNEFQYGTKENLVKLVMKWSLGGLVLFFILSILNAYSYLKGTSLAPNYILMGLVIGISNVLILGARYAYFASIGRHHNPKIAFLLVICVLFFILVVGKTFSYFRYLLFRTETTSFYMNEVVEFVMGDYDVYDFAKAIAFYLLMSQIISISRRKLYIVFFAVLITQVIYIPIAYALGISLVPEDIPMSEFGVLFNRLVVMAIIAFSSTIFCFIGEKLSSMFSAERNIA